MRWLPIVLCAMVPGVAEAAGSFIYVPVLPCTAGVCAPEVQVYNATTAGLVTRIPLTANSTLGSFALSYDGSRLFVMTVSQGTSTLNVIDTSRHVVSSIYPGVSGLLAVSSDPNTVFLLQQGPSINVFDLALGRIARTIALPFGVSFFGFVVTPAGDRAYVSGPASPGTIVRSYDLTTGASSIVDSAFFQDAGLAISRDGARLYETLAFSAGSHPTDPSVLVVRDTATNRVLYSRDRTFILVAETVGVESFRSARSYIWDDYSADVIDPNTGAILGSIQPLSPAVRAFAIAGDDTRGWMATTTALGNQNRLAVFDTATNQIITTIPLAGSPAGVMATPPGAPTCSYQTGTHQSSWTVNGGTASLTLFTACPWLASSDSSWARIDRTSGTGDATFTLTVDQNFTTTNRSATLTIGGQLVTVAQASFSAVPPFGIIDTPSDNVTGITGALNVTGWALDDVGVARVRIYRDATAGETPGTQIYIGDATFVDGARPDVQAAFPGYPNASRGGWGLQILTNMLPGAGTGSYRLTALADDVEGHTTVLGARTITCANATASLPFGTIDTPGNGDIVSGTVVNFGWALAPPPAMIPLDGSTIDVLVDGALVGHPTFGFARSDIDSLFPGYANSGKAVGFFMLDTTAFANGLHTIAWIVHDNRGATQGIGSRFFVVANP